MLLGIVAACQHSAPHNDIAAGRHPLEGTWRLISGTTIVDNDTTVTDYTSGQEMIKIITPTHFAFMRHSMEPATDSTRIYFAGGGRVKLEAKKYTEYLDYFSQREWEGGVFELYYEISGDTLRTRAVERVAQLGVDQINLEVLIREK